MFPFLHFLAASQAGPLIVDPLLIVQAKEIWSVIGRRDNPVWPGWDARRTPILIYLPGKQDVLINHPKPPAGFRPYAGPLKSSLGPIWIKDGPTILELDGQNTSIDVNGTQTLVVADTLSSRRQWVQSVAGHADQIEGGLYPDPYGSMTLFAHEAFHVFQNRTAPQKAGNETVLTRYPSLSVENNVGYALEADFLAAALRAKTPTEVRVEAVKWLAVRQARRKALSKEAADYEDGTEFNEGLAKYVEYRLLQSLEARKPAPDMWLVQGFRGYGNVAAERDRLVKSMGGFLSGANSVNNDLYGASPVRFRLYYSGMGVSALLDRLGADWKPRILTSKTTLTELAAEALKTTPAEIEAALASVHASPRFATLTLEKEALARDGEKHIRTALAEISDGPGELILDYSKLEKPRIGFSFTPFGILRVDDQRAIYRLIPIRGLVGGLNFSEDSARPILHDLSAKRVSVPLTATPDEQSIREQLAAGDQVKLPGVSLTRVKAIVRVEGKRVVFELLP